MSNPKRPLLQLTLNLGDGVAREKRRKSEHAERQHRTAALERSEALRQVRAARVGFRRGLVLLRAVVACAAIIAGRDARAMCVERECAVGGEVSWPAAITANRRFLAVGTRAGTLSVLNLMTGLKFADFPADDEVTAPAIITRDRVIYGAWDGKVRSYHIETGQLLFTHDTRAEVTAAPALVGDNLLVPSRDGHLHALDATTGVLRWAYRAGAPVAGPVVV